MVVVLAAAPMLLERILSECVTLLTSFMNQIIPIGVLLETVFVTNDPQEMLSSRDCDVHSAIVSEES